MNLQEVFAKKTYRPRLKNVAVGGPFRITVSHEGGEFLTNAKKLEDVLAFYIKHDQILTQDPALTRILIGLRSKVDKREFDNTNRRDYVEFWLGRFLENGYDDSLWLNGQQLKISLAPYAGGDAKYTGKPDVFGDQYSKS